MWRLNDTGIIAGGGTGYGILLLVMWLKIFGLSVINGELFSYTAGILALLALYYTVRRWQGERAALFSVVFAASCGPFFVNFYVRPDSLATLCYILILWLYIVALEQKKTWLHFAVGVAVVGATEIYTFALLYAAGLSLPYLYRIWQQKRLPSETIAFFLGAMLAGVLYLAIHVLPNLKQYLLIPTQCTSNCLPFGPERELIRMVEFFLHYPVESILFVLAIVGAISRKNQFSLHFLLMTLGTVLALIVLVRWPLVIYSGQLWPLMAIGVGVLLAQGIRRDDLIVRRSTQIQFFVVILLFSLQIIRPSYVPVQTIPDNVIAYLHRYVPTQTVIMGAAATYYQLLDYPEFVSYRDGDHYGVDLRGESYLAFWEREKPQVFIGNPADDEELLRYFQEDNFTQVLPDLWISKEIRESANTSTGG
jgi:4-amino-4-deoxy-L-arabinose transferase-like glycosyltransferase